MVCRGVTVVARVARDGPVVLRLGPATGRRDEAERERAEGQTWLQKPDATSQANPAEQSVAMPHG